MDRLVLSPCLAQTTCLTQCFPLFIFTTGDGGNDCGALKAAHVGVALSDAEASIVSPFTSLDRSITACVTVLKEGRCALASALAVYKFIIMYGLITVINQMMTAYFKATFAEWNWVFIDAVWVICMAYTLPLARSAKTLAKTRPTASILGLQTVSSAGGIIIIHFTFTVIALAMLFNQEWFQCRKWVPTDMLNALVLGDNYESQIIWLVTGYQYISSAIAFNFGYEFRQGWFRNYVFILFVLGFSIIHFYIIFVPGKLSCFFRVNCVNENVVAGVTGGGVLLPIQNSFNTTMIPFDFQWKTFVIIICNTIAVVGYEYFVVNGIRKRSAAKKAKRVHEAGELVQHRGSNFGARRASVEVEIVETDIKTSSKQLSRRASAFSSRYLMEGSESERTVYPDDGSSAMLKPGRRRSVFLADDNFVEI
jgi:magnesium-transporting ATPase (P-type)